jgi:hypothetical protein
LIWYVDEFISFKESLTLLWAVYRLDDVALRYVNVVLLGFHDMILVYDKWADDYKGFTIDQLTHFVSVGQCV